MKPEELQKLLAQNPELSIAHFDTSGARIAETPEYRPGARLKYGNRKAEVDGHVFDSQKEASRYLVLRAMVERGEIHDLKLQPRFELMPAFIDVHGQRWRAIHYMADFSYVDCTGVTIVEDVKSEITAQNAVFRLKWRLVQYYFRENKTIKFMIV